MVQGVVVDTHTTVNIKVMFEKKGTFKESLSSIICIKLEISARSYCEGCYCLCDLCVRQILLVFNCILLRQRDDSATQNLKQHDSNIADFHNFKATLAEKITQNMHCRESLNSSGTVSRKTSTTSEYTPEHTMINDTRPVYINDTNVSYVTDTCVTTAEAISPIKDDIIVVKDVQHDYKMKEEGCFPMEADAMSESAIGGAVPTLFDPKMEFKAGQRVKYDTSY